MSAAQRRKPTPRARTRESYRYSRANYRVPARRTRRLPVVAGVLVVAVLATGVAFGARSWAGCSSQQTADDGQAGQAQQTEQVQQQAGSAPAGGQAADNSSIVMTVLGSRDTYVKRGESYIEPGCHAVDKSDGDLTARVQTQGEVDASTAGDYTVTYSVGNDAGAAKSATRTVHVVDDAKWNSSGISVLMYHYVYTDDDPPASSDTNYLHADKLAKQCAWLQKQGYYYPSYKELSAWLAGTHSLPAKSVVLTFDDGQKGFLAHGIPVLEKYQVPATSFVIGDRKATRKNLLKYASEYVTFQSHSYGLHNDGNTNKGRGGRIYDLNKTELADDARKMSEMLGGYEAFAYPYGDVTKAATKALKESGVLCAFTIEYGQVRPGDDPMRLKRVRMFRESSLSAFKNQVKHGS